MNKVVLHGRLTRDPELRYSQNQQQTAVTRFTLAVNRRIQTEGGVKADFINCVAFGKTAETIEKYFRQGSQITLSGRIQTGNYTNKDGTKVNTFDVVIEEFDFVDSKNNSSTAGTQAKTYAPQQSSSQNNPQSNRTGSYQQPGFTPAQYAGGFVPAGMQPQQSLPPQPKASQQTPPASQLPDAYAANGFMNIPEGLDEELPFNQKHTH